MFFNWSSGKDAAFALHKLLGSRGYSVEYLLTTVNSVYNRVTMHGLRREMLERQLHAVGIPYGTVDLPETPSNEEYERRMGEVFTQLKADGFEAAGYGDILLNGVKTYREQQLRPYGMAPVFPLWGMDTHRLMEDFIDSGFKAVTVCVNAELLDRSFAGRIIDKDFLNDLPEEIDPAGENGEYHTFCFDGPLFNEPIRFQTSETVRRAYGSGEYETEFWFTDLSPG